MGILPLTKHKISVKLYQFGTDLLSRSEAKRVTMGLENFQEIELDFKNVATIGQGFRRRNLSCLAAAVPFHQTTSDARQ